MQILAQIAMVMNLDKCIGCHTCSVTCKNVWTSKKGAEYIWFNNVETKPGIGYPDDWENQERWKGGWKLDKDRLTPMMGNKLGIMKNIFASPTMPQIDDYYEPFTFNYSILHKGSKFKTPPTARPHSILSGKVMDKIEKTANWEDDLGGEFKNRSKETNFKDVPKDIYGELINSFIMYLPRICEHCLNPSCVAVCPSGAIYKREEDGIVLIDQDRCRGWRQCVSGCPYKKVYFNWQTHKSEKCTFCYPRVEVGESTLCSESGILPDVDDMRISHKYLANMFTAGDEKPIKDALKRMLAMRAYMRSTTVDDEENIKVLEGTGLTPEETEKMYHLMAIANYDDRFVIPTSHKEEAKNVYQHQSTTGYPDGDSSDDEEFKNLFGGF